MACSDIKEVSLRLLQLRNSTEGTPPATFKQTNHESTTGKETKNYYTKFILINEVNDFYNDRSQTVLPLRFKNEFLLAIAA